MVGNFTVKLDGKSGKSGGITDSRLNCENLQILENLFSVCTPLVEIPDS